MKGSLRKTGLYLFCVILGLAVGFIVVALSGSFIGCSNKQNNPVGEGASEKPSITETLIFSQSGLIDSVTALTGISENTHVINLGMLDYSGATKLRIKYRYFASRDSSGIWANDVQIYSGIYAVYHSGGLERVSGYTNREDVIDIQEPFTDITKLRLTVYYSARLLSVRDLQIYKF